MLEKTGLSSYRELALWAKERVQLRRVGEINSALHRDDLGRLFMEHFKMSGDETEETYGVLVGEGHIREHKGTGGMLDDTLALETLLSKPIILESGFDPVSYPYVCSTWEL